MRLVCFLLFFVAAGVLHAAPPNIVLIVADDLGYGDLGCYGGKAKTPNLDRMAAEGLRFTDFHSNGSVCSPTRASLMTGRYPHRLGIESALPADWNGNDGLGATRNHGQITIASRLREAGYATAIFGKWHLGKNAESNPTLHGFDEFRGLTCGCGDYFAKIDRTGHEDWWHNTEQAREGGYVTSVLTEHAVRFIDENKARPFFLYLPHLAIHFPWQGPDDEVLGIRQKGVAFGKGAPGPRSKLGPHAPEEVPSVVIRMIEELDASVGRVLTAIKEHGLDDNTLIFFTSDNGGYLRYAEAYTYGVSNNGPLRGQKGDVYEGGHRVPAIARWPGRIPAGGVSDAIAMSMDLVPTFMEFANVPAPAVGSLTAFDGISLAALLTHNTALPERPLFWRNVGPKGARAVRLGSWKLVQPAGNRSAELYQLGKDIGETDNVSASHPEEAAMLQQHLTRWEATLLP